MSYEFIFISMVSVPCKKLATSKLIPVVIALSPLLHMFSKKFCCFQVCIYNGRFGRLCTLKTAKVDCTHNTRLVTFTPGAYQYFTTTLQECTQYVCNRSKPVARCLYSTKILESVMRYCYLRLVCAISPGQIIFYAIVL